MIRLVCGSLDRGPANDLYRSAKSAGLAVEHAEESYTRQFIAGRGGVPDPEYRKPVYIVRVEGSPDLVAAAMPPEVAEAILAGRRAGTAEDGRSWWAT